MKKKRASLTILLKEQTAKQKKESWFRKLEGNRNEE